MENNEDLTKSRLSNDPEENLRMENELLRLKLLAELGADSQSSESMDPAIENQFLKQVMAFEQSYHGSKRATIFQLLDRPAFIPADELPDALIASELGRVISLLKQRNIEVDFTGTYDDRTKYAFITEELFDQETDDFSIPGMTTHFTYEEFHPDHRADIKNRAEEFITGWFKRTLDEKYWCLDETFILPNSTVLSKKVVAEKLKIIFDSFAKFSDCQYIIEHIDFTLNDHVGMGFAEGKARYVATLENNEKINIAGPFKLYLSLDSGWWSIFHIVFPGFEY